MPPVHTTTPSPPPNGPRLSRGATGCVVLGTIAFAAATVRLPLSPLRACGRGRCGQVARMSTRRRADVGVGGGAGVIREGRRRGGASAAIIFMHGLGDTAAGWAPAFPLLEHVRAVLPTAAAAPVSLNAGLRMPSWFDLHGLDAGAREDAAGIAAAVARVDRIIDEQIAAGIPANRIVVAGFSQGGALALTAALRSRHRLAGVAGLSAWLPLRAAYPRELAPHATQTPVLMCHGTHDMVVRFPFGEQSSEFLRALGFSVSFKAYPGMQHSACDAEMEDLKAFLASVLPPEK